MVASPVMPVAQVWVLVLGTVAVAAVRSSKEVVATAEVAAVLPHDPAIAIAEVVPLGGPPRRKTMIPQRPR